MILFFFPSSRHISGAWVVYLGRERQVGSNTYEVERSVSKIIVHPQYNESILDNDVALMKLSTPVTFTNHIRPICLASNSSQFYASTTCWATGWAKQSGESFLTCPSSTSIGSIFTHLLLLTETNLSYRRLYLYLVK